jgi:hypothetical protein
MVGNSVGYYYTPCFIQSSGFPVANASNVYLPNVVTSAPFIITGKTLYQSYNTPWTNLTAIADSNGVIYAVNSSGVVGAAISTC